MFLLQRVFIAFVALTCLISWISPVALAQEPQAGGEVNLVLPDLEAARFPGGVSGRSLLMWGLAVSALGMIFGLVFGRRLRNMPVHSSMKEISELIYETCKTYLLTQGKFLLILEVFVGAAIILYFGFLQRLDPGRVAIILAFSLVGIGGSFLVAWFGIRVNTFANSRTAKPVLIGTAVVGATTMIFSTVVLLTAGLQPQFLEYLSILHPPFLLGLVAGGSVIYGFTGASIQAVSTGAYRAVEFIKANMNLETTTRASVADSKKVVEICTEYAQKGMLNTFLAVLFTTLAFAFFEPFFFIGYLISIALVGLFQAIFMANAGGAWDNAKKVVETELKAKGTDLHAATIVGDTVGDPFKDTSSVALNPIIKFTTLFGLLAVELAVSISRERGTGMITALAVLFLAISIFFVYRSFYGMRIGGPETDDTRLQSRGSYVDGEYEAESSR